MLKPESILKKLPEMLRELRRSIPPEKKIRLMFQDEARFGRVSLPRRILGSARM